MLEPRFAPALARLRHRARRGRRGYRLPRGRRASSRPRSGQAEELRRRHQLRRELGLLPNGFVPARRAGSSRVCRRATARDLGGGRGLGRTDRVCTALAAALGAAGEHPRGRRRRRRRRIRRRRSNPRGSRRPPVCRAQVVVANGCWAGEAGGCRRTPAAGAPGEGGDPHPARRRTNRFASGWSSLNASTSSRAPTGGWSSGATVEERGFDTTVTAGGVLELLREAYRALPDVAELELVETSPGLRPGTPTTRR